MTGTHHRLGGPASADEPVGLDAVVPARDRAEPPPLPATAWSNVVPFVRPRADAPAADLGPKLVVSAADRPAPDLTGKETRARILALVALSLLIHAGLYLATNREPEPMASIGLEAISVELVLGANSPAGAGNTPSESPTQSAPTPVQQTEPDRTEVQEQKAPDQSAAVEPDVTPQTTPPPEEQPQPPEPQQPEAMQPQAAPVTEAPVAQEPVKPQPKPVPKQETKQETKPKPAPKHEAKPKAAPKRQATRTDTPGPRANAANGIGAGRSANDANYRGLVAAHLARYKRFPPEAQRNGAQGSASVRFVLSGSGGVTSVSLVRGTGVAALDQEAVAMVHRASPFPAPPNGRPISFTVPVSYKMR
jgi:periplasmic protein TonB